MRYLAGFIHLLTRFGGDFDRWRPHGGPEFDAAKIPGHRPHPESCWPSWRVCRAIDLFSRRERGRGDGNPVGAARFYYMCLGFHANIGWSAASGMRGPGSILSLATQCAHAVGLCVMAPTYL